LLLLNGRDDSGTRKFDPIDKEGFHSVNTAGTGLFGGFDRWRDTAGGSLVHADLTQILDAVFGKQGRRELDGNLRLQNGSCPEHG